MTRGVIYVMSTAVTELVKIGKTGADVFERRMYSLERNGYANVVGLRREFAILVDDFDEKESPLYDIFSKSCVPNTELFALDINLVVQLLSSFEGQQVYPETQTKEDAFDETSSGVSEAIRAMCLAVLRHDEKAPDADEGDQCEGASEGRDRWKRCLKTDKED